jgi:hypothetical protein
MTLDLNPQLLWDRCVELCQTLCHLFTQLL